MKTAFYHMAVWNVPDAKDIIQEIIHDNDSKGSKAVVKPVSVAEKVRSKAAKMRRDERLGNSSACRGGHDLKEVQEEGSEGGGNHERY